MGRTSNHSPGRSDETRHCFLETAMPPTIPIGPANSQRLGRSFRHATEVPHSKHSRVASPCEPTHREATALHLTIVLTSSEEFFEWTIPKLSSNFYAYQIADCYI